MQYKLTILEQMNNLPYDAFGGGSKGPAYLAGS
jgi:hypothetical protein